MRSFGRVIRIALRHRLAIVAIALSSFLVAALWGSSISAVYPFVELVIAGKSFPQWAEETIASSEQRIASLEQEIGALREQAQSAGGEPSAAVAGDISRKQMQLEAAREALALVRWQQPYIEQYAPRDAFQTLILLIGLLVTCTLAKAIFLGGNMVLVEWLGEQTAFELRTTFFRRTLQLDMNDFSGDRTSNLISHFTYDLAAAREGVSIIFGRLIREPLKMAACLIGAAWISWRLLLFSLIVAPLALYVITKLASSLKRANRRAMQEMSQVYNRLAETFQGIETVKAYTAEQLEQDRFTQTASDFFRKAMRIAFYNALARPLTEVMGMAILCAAVISGGYLVLYQETHLWGIKLTAQPLSHAAIMTFYAMMIGLSDPIRKLSDILQNMQKSVAAAERIFPLIDREPTVLEKGDPQPIGHPLRNLTLENVCFRYRGDEPLLEDISLEIKAGETLAIVGSNGCGKSTLVKLIPRFYDPLSGAVRWNGTDLRDLSKQQLRRRIAMVTQQTVLFDDTVENNIAYGSPEASQVEIVAAAKRAHAHGFITDKLQDGYQSLVGEAGKRLSGGQRQRIALARAILRDPEVLILDEATSQIDVESEQLIHQTLAEFKQGRTMLVITHRATTLELADRILVMDAGRIVDLGTHEELSSRCELYSRWRQSHYRAA
jgi:ATP-binding cassette, subfamily B, bacterial MsbA